MNYNDFIVFDFETGHYDTKTCALLQLAAVHIDCRSLKIGEKFQSYIRPEPGYVITPEALAHNNITMDMVENAPTLKQVYTDFSMFVDNFNRKKNDWGTPIGAGYNIAGFDMPLIQRTAEQFNMLDKNGKQKIFSNFTCFDLMMDFWRINENSTELKNLKFSETICPYLGIKADGAHNAIVDVDNTAKVLVRILKLYREWFPRVKMKGALYENRV